MGDEITGKGAEVWPGDGFAGDFGPFEGRTWLNCAHQGPLPRVSAQAAQEAISWKRAPHHMVTDRFSGVPDRLRRVLARLIDVPEDELILANSASYGLHLLANGIPWRRGDEVLLVRGDFPSDVLPWLALERAGVGVRFIEPEDHLPTPAELRAALTPATRLFCTTWVHSFSGVTADLDGLGKVCREHDVTFVVNASQGLGARPLSLSEAPVDALSSVGFKWLCGPYGTGLCWIRRDLLERLEYNKAYWLSRLTADDLASSSTEIPRLDGPATARSFDIFGTANFFNYLPWTASVEYLLDVGAERIAAHDQALIDRLIDGLDEEHYRLLSPRSGLRRSTLVFVSHVDSERNLMIHRRIAEAGIDVALRRGNLRIAPHLHNTPADIDRLLDVLGSVADDG